MAWREQATLGDLHVGRILNAAFTIGAEAANVINVAVAVTSSVTGKSTAQAVGLPFYLSSDAAGQVLEGTGPTSIAVGTNGVTIPSGGDSVVTGTVVTETTGLVDLDLTLSSGADTFYLNLVMPDGRIMTSGAITFAA